MESDHYLNHMEYASLVSSARSVNKVIHNLVEASVVDYTSCIELWEVDYYIDRPVRESEACNLESCAHIVPALIPDCTA